MHEDNVGAAHFNEAVLRKGACRGVEWWCPIVKLQNACCNRGHCRISFKSHSKHAYLRMLRTLMKSSCMMMSWPTATDLAASGTPFNRTLYT